MARKKEKLQIDGHEVEIYQLPIPQSLKVMTRLMKILGKPLGAAASGGASIKGKDVVQNVLDNQIDLESIMGHLAESLDEDIVESTIRIIIPYVHIDGKQMKTLESFDEFGVGMVLKAIGEALKVNYSDFFGELLGGGAKEKIETES